MEYQPAIGLEIHTELNTLSKMFCSCLNDANEKKPNVNICPVCMGHPGTLPVANKQAIRKVIKTGLAFNCQIPEYSKFDRKNYFYPDLPKGYQISQYDMPLCKNGYLEISSFDNAVRVNKSQIPNPNIQTNSLDARRRTSRRVAFQIQNSKTKKIRITRIHLEEDTGKLIHPVRDYVNKEEAQREQISNEVHPKGASYSLVDFNRAGIPLMELVTEPDIQSAQEARKFAQELQLILRYLDVSSANMEKGQMRVEVNISLSKKKNKLGTKVEIKNLNSFRAVEKAIEYEIKRQTKILETGKKVNHETRGWHNNKQITISQREKEKSPDYRYFPEPDLPILRIGNPKSQAPNPKQIPSTKSQNSKHNIINIEEIKAEIPELPQARRERFKEEYNLSNKEIETFTTNKDLGEYFEKVMSEFRNWIKEGKMKAIVSEKEFKNLAKIAANYIITNLQGILSNISVISSDFLISSENFAEFTYLIYTKTISSKIAKQLLKEMFKTGADPSHIIKEKDLIQLTNEAEIEKIIKEIISKNQKVIEDFKKGKENALQFLIGQVMKATKGRAEPKIVNKLLKQKLKI